jgi:hypothetical protein
LYSDGVNKRLVRSPPAPNMTSVHGGAGRLPAGPAAAACGPAPILQLADEVVDDASFASLDMAVFPSMSHTRGNI